MLMRRTPRAPSPAVFQIAERTVLPSHATSRGRPTLSETSFIAPRRSTSAAALGERRRAAASGWDPRRRRRPRNDGRVRWSSVLLELAHSPTSVRRERSFLLRLELAEPAGGLEQAVMVGAAIRA